MLHSLQPQKQEGQAAVESIFSVLLILLLILASGQILYTSLISGEAVKRAHRAGLEFFRDMNGRGNQLNTEYRELRGEVEVEPGRAYALVVNGWTLFHKKHPPTMSPRAKFSGGQQYVSRRGIYIAAGPLKGPGGVVDTRGEGRSAFGVRQMPYSDGDGYNISGRATRNEAFERLTRSLGIQNRYDEGH